MAMKTMNLARLPVWIIVAIHIFHCGAGETVKWFKFGCSNYSFHKSRQYWEQSRQLCQRTGKGDLVSIESEEEWNFLNNTISNLTMADEYFIGLRKDDQPELWRWLSNKSANQTDLPWAEGEPNGDGECADMYKNYKENYGKYNDLDCTTVARSGFICELPIDGCNQKDNCQGVCFNHSAIPTTSTLSVTTKSTAQWRSGSSIVYDLTTASDVTVTSSDFDGSKGDNDKSSTTVIAAASLAAVLFVVLIVLVVILLLRRRKRRGRGKDEETPPKKSKHQPARLGDNQYEPVDRVEVAKLLGSSDNNKSEKKAEHESPPANCEYAVVNKKDKKRKEGDLVYAQLAEFDSANNDNAAQKSPSYEPTVYADVDVVPPNVFNSTSVDSTQPTYANVETTGV